MHPWAVKFWDHQLHVNLILYGNYNRLRDAAIAALGPDLSGRTLQVAACYGNFTPHLAQAVAQAGGTLDVIDVLPVQLERLRQKLSADAPVDLMLMDASDLKMAEASYDRVVIFILLHEQPPEYRRKTLREAYRVLKPGGTIVLVDFANSVWWHPVRYLWFPILRHLKPFGWDMWNHELSELMPEEMAQKTWTRRSYFGGMFQILRGT